MNKEKLLETEINYIKNKDYKESLVYLVTQLPDYFFKTPAASTGKYHPSYAQGDGGLLRHTKAAAKIANELLYCNDTMGKYYTDNEKDLMIFGLIMHDGLKLGVPEERYTRFDHPLLIGKFIKENQGKTKLSNKEVEFLNNVISSHMGQWSTDYQGNEALPKPANKFQNFVHMCDFLASRKFLEVPFNNNNEIKKD